MATGAQTAAIIEEARPGTAVFDLSERLEGRVLASAFGALS
jgi:hypothetical protein